MKAEDAKDGTERTTLPVKVTGARAWPAASPLLRNGWNVTMLKNERRRSSVMTVANPERFIFVDSD